MTEGGRKRVLHQSDASSVNFEARLSLETPCVHSTTGYEIHIGRTCVLSSCALPPPPILVSGSRFIKIDRPDGKEVRPGFASTLGHQDHAGKEYSRFAVLQSPKNHQNV